VLLDEESGWKNLKILNSAYWILLQIFISAIGVTVEFSSGVTLLRALSVLISGRAQK